MITVKTESTSRVLYIDILRIVSIFAVILLHVSAPYVENMHAYGANAWWVGNMVDSATRWCVPVLIMVSGKLMLNNNKDIRIIYFLKKRLIKVLVPLIFWSFIYMIWNNRFVLEWNLDLFLNFIKKLYEGNVYIHLWYLYMIIGLYLITPIIKAYIDKAKRSSIIYFLVIWFIANGIIGFWEKFIDLKTNFNLDFFHWSIGFYILGAFLDKEKLSKKVVFLFHSLGLIGLLLTITGTYIYTINNNGIYISHFYSYLAPNVIFMSVSVFLIFKRIDWEKLINKDSFIYKVILSFSSVTFGIYLIHLLVLDLIKSEVIEISISTFSLNLIFNIFLLSILTFFISYFITVAIQKVPLLNKVVPN